jgi:pyrimidine-nucleoside phosphorylase
MRAVDIIIKKRDHGELSSEEIEYFIQGYTRGEITDDQAAAFCMAVLLNGMTAQETTDLTLAMAYSGETLDLRAMKTPAVDKHSTGGVGDKTTLVAEPLVAACGLPVGKMSGRGLGFSGGTLDKMESIPGYRTNLSTVEFLEQLSRIGLVLTGQSADLAPADGKLYALRDVTGTVQSIPLIASSIMSKKIAAGAQAIVLDVKVGLGAFMETEAEARRLAELMVAIGRLAGRRTIALLSNMNQPLGQAVGNAIELREAIQTLQGGGPSDFREHCLVIAGQMLALGGKAIDANAGIHQAERALSSGKGFELFRKLVGAQEGDIVVVDNPARLPAAPIIETIPAPRSGFLRQVHARIIGETAVYLGAGRNKKGEPIDHAVGIIVQHKIGDYVDLGEPLYEIHVRTPGHVPVATQKLLGALTWSDTRVDPEPLFFGTLSS